MPVRMSFTNTVPVAVPSLFHNSRPLVPSSAEKKSVPPMPVRFSGAEPMLPLRMSFTSTVPAAVPLLAHSSAPPTPSSAVK